MIAPVQFRRAPYPQWIVPLGEPDPNPALPCRGYRSIYPYSRLYSFGTQPVKRVLDGWWLENELISLLVTPELGGHVWKAVNRRTGRDLFHTPEKAGLINFSLRGAWYTGGVEFNFPNSHSVTTPEIIPAQARRYEDGGAAIQVGNLDLAWRAGWRAGVRLQPGSASISFDILLYNRQAVPLRYFWWLNSALPTDDSLEYVNGMVEALPHFVGRREHRSEPVDWPVHAGRDLRWFKDSPEPTSLFLLAGDERWFGFYHHGSDQGVVRLGSPAEAPGLKFWSSGQAEEGYQWGKRLTCGERFSNSELQSGRPETQTDYGILPPYAVLHWTEVWRPVWGLGGVTAASEAAAIHLLPAGQGAHLRLLPEIDRPGCTVQVQGSGHELALPVDLSAADPAELVLPFPAETSPLQIKIFGPGGEPLLAYARPGDRERRSILADVLQARYEPAPLPDELSAEQLVIEAERYERLNLPEPAESLARQALERDPGLIGAHLVLAWRDLREGRYEQARQHARRIMERQPRHEWAHAVLALAWLRSGDRRQAEVEFERLAGQGYDTAAFAWLHLAQLRLARQEWAAACTTLDRCLERQRDHIVALALMAAALRHTPLEARSGPGLEQAAFALQKAWQLNPFDPLVRMERHFAGLSPHPFAPHPFAPPDGDEPAITTGSPNFARFAPVLTHDDLQAMDLVDSRPEASRFQDAIEAACDYFACGLLDEARAVLAPFSTAEFPLANYYRRYLDPRSPSDPVARLPEAPAERRSTLYPSRWEDAPVFSAALQEDPGDGLAHLSLGMLEVYRRNYSTAAPHLELAAELRTADPQPQRLLALAAQAEGRLDEAAFHWREAVRRSPADPTLRAELDELLAGLPETAAERVRLWENAPQEALKPELHHDGRALGRCADALLEAGQPQRALETLAGQVFFPEEGSSTLRDLHAEAHLTLGLNALDAGNPGLALEHAGQAAAYPEALGLAEPFIRYDAPAYLLAALAHSALGDPRSAQSDLERAAAERHRETNEAEFAAALALRGLGREQEAAARLQALAEKGERDLAWPDRDPAFARLLIHLGTDTLPDPQEAGKTFPRYARKVRLARRLADALLQSNQEVP